MAEAGTAARRGAIALLGAVLGENRLLSESLGVLERYEAADRARAQRLATETLRMLERADRILSRHLQRPPPLFVRNALRLGTVELCAGGAAHGVVHDIVAIVGRNKKTGALKGLTNAVLRKVATDGPEIWPTLRVPRLPKALRGRLMTAWGAPAVSAMETVHAMRPPLDLTSRGDAGALAETLSGELLPTGSVRLSEPGQISNLEGYDTGAWWVQDAAAAIPARVLAVQPGERVLDMCAAPGGKTMQLAAAGADVTALDNSEQRMARVEENLARTELTAKLVIGDARTHQGVYDAILLDAPCSATGTIRRHPDLPYIKALGDLGPLLALQAALLTHAWDMLVPGGRLVYCTCSLLPEEGEGQISQALKRLPGASVDANAIDRPGLDPAWRTNEGGLRLRPDFWADQGGMDGFYVACLTKSA